MQVYDTTKSKKETKILIYQPEDFLTSDADAYMSWVVYCQFEEQLH